MTRFPALCVSYMYLLRVWLVHQIVCDWEHLWLAKDITLVSLSRHWIEPRSNNIFSNSFNIARFVGFVLSTLLGLCNIQTYSFLPLLIYGEDWLPRPCQSPPCVNWEVQPLARLTDRDLCGRENKTWVPTNMTVDTMNDSRHNRFVPFFVYSLIWWKVDF